MAVHDGSMMRLALELAAEAAAANEVPIGAVVVSPEGEIVGKARNRSIEDSDPTAHAEILAVRRACARAGNYRLVGATIFSTIEPCVMCAGALVNARITRLVYGAADERFGAVRTHFQLADSPILNHRIEITQGVLADECRALMQDFFRRRR